MRRRFNRILTASAAIVVGVLAPVISAKAAYYADVSVEYHTVEISGVKFNPYTARLKLGAPLPYGFGIEASYAGPMNDDSVNQLKLDIEQQASLHVRYQGSGSYNGMTLYLILGQTWTTLKTSGPNAVPEQDFDDLSWGIGAEDRSRSVKNLSYSFQYTRHYHGDGLNMSGVSLGLRYDF